MAARVLFVFHPVISLFCIWIFKTLTKQRGGGENGAAIRSFALDAAFWRGSPLSPPPRCALCRMTSAPPASSCAFLTLCSSGSATVFSTHGTWCPGTRGWPEIEWDTLIHCYLVGVTALYKKKQKKTKGLLNRCSALSPTLVRRRDVRAPDKHFKGGCRSASELCSVGQKYAAHLRHTLGVPLFRGLVPSLTVGF